MTHRSPSVLVACVLAGCVGEVGPTGGGGTPGGAPTPGGEPAVPSAPGAPTGAAPSAPASAAPTVFAGASLRRLTRFEYDNTLRDLLGDTTRPAAALPEEERIRGFDNDAGVQTVSPAMAEKLLDVAGGAAERAVKNLKTLAACAATVSQPGAAWDACAQRFVRDLGRRAWRRPLSDDEAAKLLALFQQGSANADFAAGARAVITRLLMGAPFLFRIETGVAVAGTNARRPTSWEMAARLSYLLWGSMPDEPLFQAAERDALTTREQIVTEARRLLADARAKKMLAHFTHQWLELEALDATERDKRLVPGFDPAVLPSLATEASLFVDDALLGGGGFAALLTGDGTFLDARLVKHYGLATGPAGAAFERTRVDPRQGGVLARGALLTVLAHPDQTSTTLRGRFVRQRLLCQEIADPPPGVDNNVPPPTATDNGRDRAGERLQSASCATCHQFMDPIGFTFEAFDTLGRWRATEGGRPVDSRGEIVGTDVAGPVDGLAALGRRLLASRQVAGCFARQWVRFAFGRAEADSDAVIVDEIARALAAPQTGLPEIAAALVGSDAFLRLAPGGRP